MKNKNLLKDMNDYFENAQRYQQQFWIEAEKDTQMYVGNQNRNYFFPGRANQGLIFNKILRIVNLISGYQIKNRMVNTIIPVENSDNKTASQLSQVNYWVSQRAHLYEKISEAFTNSLVTGFSMMSLWMDHRKDPANGDIHARVVPYSNFILDPFFKNADLSDAEWIWNRSYRTKKQVIKLFPALKNDESLLSRQGMNVGSEKFPFMAENSGMRENNLVAYDEFWAQDVRKEERIIDIETGDVMVRSEDMDDEFIAALMRFNENVRVTKTEVPTVKYHIVVNGEVMYEEKTPYGLDRFPYVPFFCYFNPEVQDYAFRYFGIVRNIRDSQFELNKRRNKMLDIMDSVVNSGVVVKEDALVNPEDAFLSGQGRVYYLKNEAQMTDIQPIPAPQIPPSMFEFQKILDEEIMSISGANEELFGTTDDKTISGFLTQLRMGAGLVSLGNIFDRLNFAQKQIGKIALRMVQENFSVGKIRRIINEQPTEEFKNKSFADYDCQVEEGVLTSTQKQLQFVQLLQLRQMGIPVPTQSLLEASTLQDKDRLLEGIMQQEQQQAAVRQAQAQSEIIKSQMMANSLDAQAESDRAMAQERKARTISNLGLAVERQAAATHDRTKSALDIAKMMKEIQELDEDRLYKLSKYVLELNEKQRENEEYDMQKKQEEIQSEQVPRANLEVEQVQGLAEGI